MKVDVWILWFHHYKLTPYIGVFHVFIFSVFPSTHRLSEDPGVISVGQSTLGDSSSYRTTPASTVTTTAEPLEVVNVSNEEEKALEGPPGLTHPTTSNHETTEMAALISTSAAVSVNNRTANCQRLCLYM